MVTKVKITISITFIGRLERYSILNILTYVFADTKAAPSSPQMPPIIKAAGKDYKDGVV